MSRGPVIPVHIQDTVLGGTTYVCAITRKNLDKGEWFTKKPIKYPKHNQVFVNDGYNRMEKKYEHHRYSDVNDFGYIKGDTIVYIRFNF